VHRAEESAPPKVGFKQTVGDRESRAFVGNNMTGSCTTQLIVKVCFSQATIGEIDNLVVKEIQRIFPDTRAIPELLPPA
jgi:hypothetical protein